MQINTDPQAVEKFFDHKIDQIYPSVEKYKELLLSGRRLKFYIGADATGPKLHLGHLVPILKMKYLQELGHEIIFLVGDFTARLGDPTDKSETRKLLSEEEVKDNAAEFRSQIAQYIDFEGGENPANIVFNSQWNNALKLSDVIRLASNTTVQQMLERDMFAERVKANKPIYLHEFLYPLIQGYDSVYMEVDGEFGGRDQTFNMLMGRNLLKSYKNIDKVVITTHFLLSADGENKMSKSIGNCIFIDDPAQEKFVKIMSIPDKLIGHYYRLATDRPLSEIEVIEEKVARGENPMQIKKELALEIVTFHDGEEQAKQAQFYFENTVQNNEIPESANTLSRNSLSAEKINLKDLIAKTNLVESNAEAKRLIRAGAVEVNGIVESDLMKEFDVKTLESIRLGKRQWLKFTD